MPTAAILTTETNHLYFQTYVEGLNIKLCAGSVIVGKAIHHIIDTTFEQNLRVEIEADRCNTNCGESFVAHTRTSTSKKQ